MRILYTIGIGFYTLGVRIAVLCGHHNAKLMVNGWSHWREAAAKLDNNRPVAWFHAASLGEFEQARPVLETYRQRHPEHQILVTFFSPSGYEIRKNYAQADAICYLPMDLPHNARSLVQAVKPSVVFFVKYEFWYNYLGELKKNNIPTYIFSTIFRPDQYFFKWYGGWFRKQLKNCFAHLFVQNTESLQLLQSHGISQCSIAGDTRFDRVHQIAVAAERNEIAEKFLENYEGKVLVAGSTWPPDEEILSKLRIENPELRIILAPHVINEEHLRQIETLFPNSIRYSECTNVLTRECVSDNTNTQSHNQAIKQSQTLIIDNIGLLSKLYRYADVAYIGGGFGVGIHNILEAVTFGKPVLFGPNYHKFQEARDIIARGGGFSHNDGRQLQAHLHPLLADSKAYDKASQACLDYMNTNLGSTEKILKTIEK